MAQQFYPGGNPTISVSVTEPFLFPSIMANVLMIIDNIAYAMIDVYGVKIVVQLDTTQPEGTPWTLSSNDIQAANGATQISNPFAGSSNG